MGHANNNAMQEVTCGTIISPVLIECASNPPATYIGIFLVQTYLPIFIEACLM